MNQEEDPETVFEKHMVRANTADDAVKMAVEMLNELVKPFKTSIKGSEALRMWILNFGFQEVLEAIEICINQYTRIVDGNLDEQTVNYAISQIPNVCYVRKSRHKELFFLRSILRKRFGDINKKDAISILIKTAEIGASVDLLKRIVYVSESWEDWKSMMSDLCRNLRPYVEF